MTPSPVSTSTDIVDPRIPFRGTRAVAAGAVTRDDLRGPRFRRLANDVHIAATTPVTLALFLHAMRLWCPDAVVRGLAAAAVWCRADHLPVLGDGGFRWPGVGGIGPVELVVAQRARAPAGTRVTQDVLAADEAVEHAGLLLTSPAMTVLDLARFQPRDVAVSVGDAVAGRGQVDLADVAELADRRPGSRGLIAARAVLSMVDRRSGNLQVSQMRLALHDHGVPAPVIDHVVVRDGLPVALADLAWPEFHCAVLCGERELVPGSEARAAMLQSIAWSVIRFGAGGRRSEQVGTEGEVFAVVAMLRAAARRARPVENPGQIARRSA